jgi:SAM-dependent methyltransferase
MITQPGQAAQIGHYGAMRQQRLVFGEVAELYDKARAAYPDALVDDVIAFAGGPALRALEVGAGTGKATVSFAVRGLDILALEPSAEMAAVARRNCRQFPRVRIEEASFEDWPAEPGGYGLLYSAQAWHWVRPEVRYQKAAEVLNPRGALALFWHRTAWRRESLRDELESLYLRLVPDLYAKRPGFPGLASRAGDPGPGRQPSESTASAEILQTGLFTAVTERTYPWPATFTADSFIDLLQTQSDHRLLPEDTRAELFAGVREIIADHGGQVVIPHATLLVLARRPA